MAACGRRVVVCSATFLTSGPRHFWQHQLPAWATSLSTSSSSSSSSHVGWKLQEDLLLSPEVAQCEVRGKVAYVVRASRPFLARLGGAGIEKILLRHLIQRGHAEQDLPEIKVVEELGHGVGRGQAAMAGEEEEPPFTLEHILEALFEQLDQNGDGLVSLDEFQAFCKESGLFAADVAQALKAFRKADQQTFRAFGAGVLDKGEFKELVLDSGIVEVRGEHTGGVGGERYFLDEHVANVVLRRWFDKYDINGNGGLDLKEYCRLVADYRLPVAVSPACFRQADKDGDGRVDLDEFKDLLSCAKVLATGEAIAKKDDREGIRAAWRALEPSQSFLPADGRVFSAELPGSLPPQDPGAVRFVCISDTHGGHDALTGLLPPGDVLLHAGDLTMCGDFEELRAVGRWLRDLPYERKVVIAGNHDLTLDRSYGALGSAQVAERARTLFAAEAGASVFLLDDEEVTVRGVRIYGSAWQPAFGAWAFNLPRGPPLAAKWQRIPTGIDVLLVHGPPMGRGDLVQPSGSHVGCADLLAELQERVRPSFCVSGHIHEARSASFDGTTHYVNATSSTEDYSCSYAPFVFDVLAR